MRHHRRWIVTATLTMLLTAGGWLVMPAVRPQRTSEFVSVSNWPPQMWFRLDGHGTSTACELPAGHRYRVVLGCLGDSTQEHGVSLQLTAAQSGSRCADTNPVGWDKLASSAGPPIFAAKGGVVQPEVGRRGEAPLVPPYETRRSSC